MGAGTGSATKLVLSSAGTGRACGKNGSHVLIKVVTTQTPTSALSKPKPRLAEDSPTLHTAYNF